MICTPDIRLVRLLAAAALLALSSCGEPAPPPPSLDEARAALSRGDPLGADIILHQLLEQGVPRAELAALMGEAELAQGELVEARRWLEPGEFDDASRGEGFHALGRLELREGRLPEAGRAFDEAFKSIPDDPELWVDIGRLRFLGGEQVQAIEASEKAVEFGPQNPVALQFRAQLVRDAYGMQASLHWFEAALQYNPDNLDLLGDYAATLGELGRAKDMLRVVRRMTELDRRNPRALYLQAVLAGRAGKYDLARRLLQLSNQRHREMPAGMLLSGIIDLRSGNYASAAQEFDKLLRQQPDNRRVRLLLARSLALGGNHRELVHRFGEEARLPSASPYLTTLVGRSHEALGDREQAAWFLERAASPRSGNLVAVQGDTPLDVAQMRGIEQGRNVLALVRGLIVAGNPAQAAQRAEAFHQRYPGSADALALAADANLAARNLSRAIELYEASAKVRRNWALTRKLVSAYRAAGRSGDAIALLRAHVAGDPANVEAVTMLAAAERADGATDRAALLYDHAIVLERKRDPDLMAARAELALEQNRPKRANTLARKAYLLQRENAQSARVLARVLAQSKADGAGAMIAKADALSREARLARR